MLRRVMQYTKRGLVYMLIPLFLGGILQKASGEVSIENISPPEIKGKIVYQTYSKYDAKDSQIYMFNFDTKENVCLNDNFKGVYNTMNPNFNSDGTEIVFMGMVKNKGVEEWDIFRYNLNTKKLEDLTKGNKLKDEDPKYSPDGTKIIFKQGHWDQKLDKMIYDLVEKNLTSGKLKKVTNDLDEDSQPCYSADGKSVYYARGAAETSEIYKVNLSGTMTPVKVYAERGTYCYYPAIYMNKLYFSKGCSVDNKTDEIVQFDLDKNTINIPGFNNQDYNTSDACPISDNYIMFSSTAPGGKGGYDLYVADLATGHTWSMDAFGADINNDKHQLGVSYR